MTASRPRLLRSLRIALFIAFNVGVFMTLALYGNQQAQSGSRVLGELETVVQLNRTSGKLLIDWLMSHGTWLGRGIVCLLIVWVTLAVAMRGRKAWPLALLAASVVALVWAQVWLWADFLPYAMWTYVAGIGLAAALGVFCPVPWAGQDQPPELGWGELAGLTLLCCFALVTRLYALTELPSFFVGEMAVSMLGSRTLAGIGRYMQEGLTGSSIVVMHLLPQMAFYEWLGTSIYSLRLVAVAFGVASVPLLYWLLRRLRGRRAAVIGSILLICAPEQLWFSRAENTNFQLITIQALISAHLAVTMLRRFSAAGVLANALWMPFTRLFYLAGVTLMVYPAVLLGHALLFVRGTWRKLWFVVPILAGGGALWWYSLSLANFAVTANWRFLNPAFHGEAVMNRDPAVRLDLTDVVQRQVESLATNLSLVIKGAVYRGGFSHWYQRQEESKYPTVYNCGAILLFALGFGYLLGQVHNRFAFALLVWFGLALLPGVLSTLPVERRMSAAFPAMYVIAAIGLDSFLVLAARRGGRPTAWLGTAVVAVVLLAVGWTSLTSHYRLRMMTLGYDTVLRFSKPVFDQSDVVFHDVDGTMAMVFGMGSADRLIEPEQSPCYQYVNPRDILQTALDPKCSFREPTFIYLLSEAEMEAREKAFTKTPQRVSFLLDGHEHLRAPINLLKRVFPQALVNEVKPDNEELYFTSVQLSRAMIDARRQPHMRLRPGTVVAPEKVFTTGQVRIEAPLPAEEPAAVVVRGGAYLRSEGWYSFRIEPPCATATIRVAGTDVSDAAVVVPLLRGVHAFEMVLPEANACRLPLRIMSIATDGSLGGRIEPLLLTDPGLRDIEGAGANTSVPLDAYGPSKFLDQFPRSVDIARSSDGAILVLAYEGNQAWVNRLRPDGSVERRWALRLPAGVMPNTITPMAGDRLAAYALQKMFIFDAEGNLVATWEDPPVIGSHYFIGLPDGRLLSPLPHYAGVSIIDADGRIAKTLRTFQGGAGKFFEPVAVALSPSGDLLVVQTNHVAHLFRNFAATLELDYVRSFKFDLTYPSVSPRALEFDGNNRILVSDPSTTRVLMYDTEGNRLVAPRRELDLGQRGLHEVLRMRLVGNQLYLDDGTRLAVIERHG